MNFRIPVAALLATVLAPWALAHAAPTGACGVGYIAPGASSYTAVSGDDGKIIGAANATGPSSGWAGASLPVALPIPASVASNWTICGTSEANKAVIFNAPLLAAPSVPSLSSTSGGTLGSATYYVKITYTNLAGETVASTEASLPVSANNRLVVAAPASSGNATGWNVYVGTASGNETKQNSSPLALGSNWTEPPGGLIVGAAVPSTGTAPVGYILDGDRSLRSFLVGTGNYQTATLTSDGTNYRVVSSSEESRLFNGAATAFPARVLYPGGPGYQTTQGDNGYAISSGATSGGLTATLPPITDIVAGWTVRFQREAGQALAIQVNSVSGGSIAYPGGTASSLTLAPYDGELATLQFDGAVFRLLSATPATNARIGVLGSTFSVANNAALKQLTGVAGALVHRDGFSTAGDGGAADYKWSGSNCTAADDGGQVQPTAITGCWIIAPRAQYDTRIWGAAVNGSTDDTVPFNKAISYVSSITGGEVYQSGTSIVGCSAPAVIKNKVTLTGPSKQVARLKLCAGSATDVLQTEGVTNLVVQGASTSSVSIPAISYSPPTLTPTGGPFSVSFTLSPKPTNPFVAGQPVQAVVPNGGAGIANWLTGTVTSYNSTSGVLVVDVLRSSGASGPHSTWYITQIGNTIINDGTASGGPYRLGLRKITLDGNAANNAGNVNGGRGFYSYAQGITFEDVDILNTRGRCWEQHNALNWLTTANDVDGIVRNLGGMSIHRCNQRGDPDMPGGIGGGSVYFNGPTDSRLGDILVGWPGPPISATNPNGVGDNVKFGPNGNAKFTQAEIFSGGNPDGNTYWPKYGVIAECITGQCMAGSGTLLSGGDAYQIINRAVSQGIVLAGSLWYIVPGASSTTSLTVGTGSTSLTTQAGFGFKAGNYCEIRQTSNGGNFMRGTVTSYNASTGALVCNITSTGGSGTATDWTVGPGFQQGGIQIGDAANGFPASGTSVDAYLTDIVGPVMNLSWAGEFNAVKLRGVMNWTDFQNQVQCTYPSNGPPCVPALGDEFDIAVGAVGSTAPVRFATPHGMMPVAATSGSAASIAAGSTVYLGPSGLSGPAGISSTAGAFRVPFPGFLQWLSCHAGSAPGSGKSFQYTPMQNTTAQTQVQGTITGTSAQDTGVAWGMTADSSGIALAAGDLVSVRLVADPGSAATDHQCTFGYAY